MKKTIVFVTGGTGFIGSHLVEKLLAKGYSVRCLVRNPEKLGYLKNLPIEIFVGDLFSSTVLEKAVKDVQYIYHVAGTIAAKKKEDFYKGNRDATKNLLEITATVNPSLEKFIHVSSLAAVGPGEGKESVTETTPYHPITTYGKSKMEAELEVLKFKKILPITIVRPPIVYGPRDTTTLSFFKTLYKGVEVLAGLKEKYVSLVHSTDLVSGIILAGEQKKSVGEIYFIGSENFYSWDEVAFVSKEVMNKKTLRIRIPEFLVYAITGSVELFSFFNKKPSVLNFEKGRDIVQDNWICSVEKAKSELGYKQSVDLQTGIRETIEWYKKNNWL